MIADMTNQTVRTAKGAARKRGRGHRTHRSRTVTSRLKGHYTRITAKRRSLTNIATCFRDQAAMLSVQCEEAQLRLLDLRHQVHEALEWLVQLDPMTTDRIRPYGSIAKLESLEFWATEAILTLAMFTPIAELVCYERIGCHQYLRSLFPRIRASFEDAISQLAALTSRAEGTQQAREAAMSTHPAHAQVRRRHRTEMSTGKAEVTP